MDDYCKADGKFSGEAGGVNALPAAKVVERNFVGVTDRTA